MSRIAMIVDDMFFASKIRAAASAANREAVSVRSLDQLEKELSDPPSVIVLDLNSNRLDALSMIESIKSKSELSNVPIVAFLSHVQVELARRAEEAGCDYVVPRSLFTRMLPQIVAGDLSSLGK